MLKTIGHTEKNTKDTYVMIIQFWYIAVSTEVYLTSFPWPRSNDDQTVAYFNYAAISANADRQSNWKSAKEMWGYVEGGYAVRCHGQFPLKSSKRHPIAEDNLWGVFCEFKLCCVYCLSQGNVMCNIITLSDGITKCEKRFRWIRILIQAVAWRIILI